MRNADGDALGERVAVGIRCALPVAAETQWVLLGMGNLQGDGRVLLRAQVTQRTRSRGGATSRRTPTRYR